VTEGAAAMTVVELTADDTHPLRLAVLRADTPTKEVAFAEDAWPGAVHLGVRIDDRLVAVSTWVPRQLGERAGVQLRGMATATAVQGTGVGGLLVEEGCRRMQAAGHRLVWARARDAALAFYLRHRFTVEGEGFVDETTQLPHHLVTRALF